MVASMIKGGCHGANHIYLEIVKLARKQVYRSLTVFPLLAPAKKIRTASRPDFTNKNTTGSKKSVKKMSSIKKFMAEPME